MKDAGATPEQHWKTTILYDRQTLICNLAALPPAHDARRVVDYTLQCLDALELRNGCAHCELRVDQRGVKQTGGSGEDPGEEEAARGKPVLIELNPRMQGDNPRSTAVVGYDQYSLMVYIAQAVNIFGEQAQLGRVAETQTPILPWPPVPILYRSMSEEPLTTVVLFLMVETSSIVNDRGLIALKSLPTFQRFTRGSFLPNKPGFVTCVRETIDLFTCPLACVMHGPEADVTRDCATIRMMESIGLSRNILARCREFIKLPNSALQIKSAAKEETVVDSNSHHRNSMVLHDVLESDSDAMIRCQLYETISEALLSQDPPPLFVAARDFSLVKACGLGSFFSIT